MTHGRLLAEMLHSNLGVDVEESVDGGALRMALSSRALVKVVWLQLLVSGQGGGWPP